MELKRTTIKNTQYQSQDSFEMTGGEKLKIKVAGDEVLNERCPAGYKWEIQLDVRVRQIENE